MIMILYILYVYICRLLFGLDTHVSVTFSLCARKPFVFLLNDQKHICKSIGSTCAHIFITCMYTLHAKSNCIFIFANPHTHMKSVYIYICIYIYICNYVFSFIYTHKYIYIYVRIIYHIHTQAHSHIHTCFGVIS